MKRSLLPFVIICITSASCQSSSYKTECNDGEKAYFIEEELAKVVANTKTSKEPAYILNENVTVEDSFPILVSSVSHQLIRRKAYTLSYNKNTKTPNWVMWCLTAEHADGDWPRDNNYYEDEDVPQPRATNADYKGSGWTRGHMCPAADNKWDSIAMRESSFLTNICPQHASLNTGLWNRIEQDCRKWARKYGDLHIVCGPVLLNRKHETIGANRVVVPEAFFKVILRMNPQPAAIGFIVRNNEGKKT